jgi:hypothetical protein
MSYDVAKLHRLTIASEQMSAQRRANFELSDEARDDFHHQRTNILQRAKWPADNEHRQLSLAEMAALPDDELLAAGVGRLEIRRAVAAEARFNSLRDSADQHAKRSAALAALVKRLNAWAGNDLGYVDMPHGQGIGARALTSRTEA